MTKVKVEEFKRQKHQAAREEVARKIAEEEELIRQKEAEVMQMEMLEMELIKKLQNTQAIQKQAYAELEDAINTRPQMHGPGSTGGPAAQYLHGSNGSMDPGPDMKGVDGLNQAMGNMGLNNGGQGVQGGENGQLIQQPDGT